MELSKNPLVHELVSNIAGNTGLSIDKASEILHTVSNFIKEKYPLLAGTVNSVLEINDKDPNEFQ
jgi:hypothetical protein